MRLAELEIPATAEYVSVARLVVSSLADDRYELTDDQIDSLKLAVSEACTMAIEPNDQASRSILIECVGSAEGLQVYVESPGVSFSDTATTTDSSTSEPGSVPTSFESLGFPFIQSLVTSAAIVDSGNGSGERICLTMAPDAV